ncbi:HRDC domain-containing protein [Microbacterium sp. ARD32]|uniref:ribonuclease D n=1 Tax=Microbacterium sp. ARD32 TaxID=2962577 RepID=UPI002881FC72|nr:HRDC domain-containing protein [Microbacterium sp. ARD32]MDT0157264.1 HRDC domain-containing protein [Microbacterium sp. ARD32]
MAEYSVIENRTEFEKACRDLASADGPVAVDVERASGFRYSQRAYLVQVFRRGAGVFLFDPPALGDFSALQAAIGDAEWVFHAASQDLPSLRELGLSPTRIFDTELASRLLGSDGFGLAAVVEHALGITLAKAHSAADWSTRPLPQPWLEYAALDVLHLIDVEDVLRQQLADAGKTEIAEQEFQATLDKEPKPPRAEPWRRLSGLHKVRGARQLAVARALWTAREEYAQEIDVSPGRLVPDRSLLAAVLASPQSRSALAALKEFNGRASRTQLDRWWTAIEQGRSTEDLPRERVPSDALPPPRAWSDRNPDADLRLKAARPVVEAIAEDLHMPTENLLTPEYLRRVAWQPPALTADAIGDALTALGARPWQVEHTAQKIADAFVEGPQSDSDALQTAS